MKELTIEEKAKAYDEALERAKELLEIGLKDTRDKRVVLSFFPELAESEDERIRKDIISYLKSSTAVSPKTWIDWLEKQGEQKPINIVTMLDDYFANTPKEQQDKDWEELKHLNNFGWELVEQKPAEWSEEDKKMIDTIIETIKMSIEDCDVDDVGTNARFSLEKERDWLKSLKDRVQPQPQQQWSEEDEDMRYKATAVINRLCAEGKEYVWSVNTLKKLFYWLKSIKARVQPKQEWNEEDINMIDWLIRCCEKEHEELCNDKYGHQDIVSDLKRDCRKKWDWLESLKNRVAPQKQWKPSKEQMEALLSEVEGWIEGCPKQVILESLYNDLKKLREG